MAIDHGLRHDRSHDLRPLCYYRFLVHDLSLRLWIAGHAASYLKLSAPPPIA